MGNQDGHGAMGYAGNNGHVLGLVPSDVDTNDGRHDAALDGATGNTVREDYLT